MMQLWGLSGRRESARRAVRFVEGLLTGRHLTREHSVLPWKAMPALTATESPVEPYHHRGAVAVVCCLGAQSCLTLCDPLDCSPPGFPVHGISQARILEWVAMPSSRAYWLPMFNTSCI